ncbi:SusD/RagB family nutrient-binding outer membrane lipoprotein [Pedobacter panaciterrae]|jgi:SusD family.|uniref:SusD/RagB family nutrient-binding outer membrane lipoprotein n=1 Tax=Pedobacter panaciterrae TaxID=363849 RepID=UPI00155DB87B|nr:SusD/RagB family nutrient-binding outer membrane lipoprotein [Pedobacter panaciterrae]NQX55395.1 SusD/RagB family nutrient-binding outer membrane lipoprotein [Pedobacter panaciterrae]
MKNISFKVFVALLTASVIFGACKKQLDINDDPSRLTPEQATISGLLASTIQFTATSFFNAGQYGNAYPQYLAGFNAYEANIDSYNPYGFDNIWESAYRDAMPNLKDLIQRSEVSGAPQYAGIGKLLLALNLMQCTDLWGDLPYKEAFKGPSVPSPTYDKQQDIYTVSLKELLDGAIADLNKPVPTNTALQVGATDLAFKGVIASWKKAAYGARARYYINLSTKDPSNALKAADDAALAIDDVTGAADLQVKYTQDKPSPWYTNLGQPAIASKQHRPSYFMVNLMNGTGYFNALIDPRLPKLFDNAGAATYIGRPVGALSTQQGASLANSDITEKTFYGARTSPVPILTYAEVQFIRAEALFATNKEGAYTAYLNGIKGNMQKLGVGTDDINKYVNDPLISKGSANLTLTDVMLQKYIALFLQMETWTDMRRYQYSNTIYPGLVPPFKNLLGTSYVQRAKYADNEPGRNPNVPQVANQAVKLWLFN